MVPQCHLLKWGHCGSGHDRDRTAHLQISTKQAFCYLTIYFVAYWWCLGAIYWNDTVAVGMIRIGLLICKWAQNKHSAGHLFLWLSMVSERHLSKWHSGSGHDRDRTAYLQINKGQVFCYLTIYFQPWEHSHMRAIEISISKPWPQTRDPQTWFDFGAAILDFGVVSGLWSISSEPLIEILPYLNCVLKPGTLRPDSILGRPSWILGSLVVSDLYLHNRWSKSFHI